MKAQVGDEPAAAPGWSSRCARPRARHATGAPRYSNPPAAVAGDDARL